MPQKYEEDFLEEVYKYIEENNKTITETARYFNVDRHTLSRRLKDKYGDDIIKNINNKKEVDSNYFEKIDTEKKAYWLGFLTADGYISSNDNTIELCLKAEDKKHIEKFKKDLKSNHKISKKTSKLNNKMFDAYKISIKDIKLNNDLHFLGLNNKKSNNAYIPFRFIPNELMPHYIRGLFDGDGSLYKLNQGKQIGITICTTISEYMIEDITKYIKNELNIDVKYNNSRNVTDIRIYKTSDVNKFYNWLYKDANIYLKRKYDKFAALGQGYKKS